ncbi:MAG: hypothetical protein FWD61_10975 [Phycisphaerales bacterium]|nr:hypothetical protein [Phycisphaerales bacterium]
MSQENLVLEYDSRPIGPRFSTVVRRIVLLFILPALVLPFVEHIGTVSPWDSVANFFYRTGHDRWNSLTISIATDGLIFFVGIPLVLCHLRLLILGELSKMETWAGYVVAVLGMAAVAISLSMIAIDLFPGYTNGTWMMREWLIITGAFMVPAVVIAFGACVVWFLGKRVSHGTRVCACLCIPYAAGLLSCAISIGIGAIGGFYISYPKLRFGYTLSLLVIVGTLIELTTLAVMAFRRRTG